MTVIIGPKPKGGRGQVLRTYRSSLEHEQSRRRFMGWRSESFCCLPLLPRPSALLASPAEAEGQQRHLSRRPPPAMSAATGDAGGGRASGPLQRTARCSWRNFRHCSGR